jgi:class II lanthipeptide synthase
MSSEAPAVLGGGDPAPLREASLVIAYELADEATPAGRPFLYDGVAGIAWFLAHVAASSGDLSLTDAARGRFDDVLGEAAAVASVAPLGLADGLCGVAVAAIEAGEALADPELVSAGRAVAAGVAERVREGGALPAEYLSGAGGVVMALLAAGRTDARGAPTLLLEASVIAGEGIIASARETPWGWSWDVPGLTSAQVPGLCGTAHGSAGVELALRELAAATGEARWSEAAARASSYVQSWYRRTVTGWPDLRALADGGMESLDASCQSSWCHGSVGIGLGWLRAYELGGGTTALAEASAALQAARAAAMDLGGRWAGTGRAPDASLCHGAGGLVELFSNAWEILHVDDHLRAARRVARLVVELTSEAGGRWAGGELDGSLPAGLFLGRAGIGAWLLRAYDPRTLPSPLLLR